MSSMVDKLVAQIDDLRRRIDAYGRLENSSSGLPTNVVKYSGTPTANAMAYWTGAGTVAHATFGTADVFLLSGNQTASGVKTFSGTVDTAIVRARSSAGLQLQEDSGIVAFKVYDGGNVETYGGTAATVGDVLVDSANKIVYVGRQSATSADNSRFVVRDRSGNSYLDVNISSGLIELAKTNLTTGDMLFDINNKIVYVGRQSSTSGDHSRFIVRDRTNNNILDVDPANSRTIIGSVASMLTGVGITPQGKLHVHDGTGGQLFVTKTAIDGSAQTIIPDGTGDVVQGMFFISVIKPSTGSVFMTSNAIANNSNTDIYSSGGNTVNLRVNSNGSVDVRRTGGSLTYTLSLFMVWL